MSSLERICYLMQVMSNHLMWQERLACWNMEHSFRQNFCKWQACLYIFCERFLLDLETTVLAILYLHSEEDGRAWGRRELRLTTRWTGLERWKEICWQPTSSWSIWAAHTPSPVPHTHRHPWPKAGTCCAFQGPQWVALLWSKEGYVCFVTSALVTLKSLVTLFLKIQNNNLTHDQC